MADRPRYGQPPRSVRVEDKLWQAAKDQAAVRGETVTDVIIRALKRYTNQRGTR